MSMKTMENKLAASVVARLDDRSVSLDALG
jgi:hypothetical protein